MQRETLFQYGFTAIASAVLALVITGSLLWIRWFRGRSKRNLCGDESTDLITRLPQPMPRWSVFGFLMMFGMMILVGALLQQSDFTAPVPPASTAPADTPPGDDASGETIVTDENGVERAEKLVTQVQVHFIANLVAFLSTLIFLRLTAGATLSHLSLLPTVPDIRRGLYATVWILAPVLLLNLVVSNLVKYEHTVTDLLAQESGTQTFLALFASAAILTPIVEEFQFRLLLQGGLQQIADIRPGADSSTSWQPTSTWPIYVTSGFFALMHLGQGAAPIPLFFLSIGLGFLYQRTGRLVPAIIVHMLLNGATLCMEFCRVNSGM